MSFIKNTFIFIVGSGLGAGVGFYVAKKVLENRLETELEDVRNYYAKEVDRLKEELDKCKLDEIRANADKNTETVEEKKPASKSKKKMTIEEASETYEEILDKTDYAEISTKKKGGKKKKTVDPDIFVITDDDFKELNGYDKVTLTYFPDEDRFLDDGNCDYDTGFEEVGGAANLEQFDDGYLYVRNRFTQTDYEVIRELRSFKVYMAEECGE